jgi:hypothetical protein
MILFVNNLIKAMDLYEPHFVIPAIPPSDNRRHIRGKGWNEVAAFKEHVNVALHKTKRTLPTPPVIVLYRIYFKTNHYREPKNCSKALIDALYPQRKGGDDNVGSWDYPFRLVDKKRPRTELWIVEIDPQDETSAESLHRQIHWLESKTGNA